MADTITYSNLFGSPGTVDIAGHYETSTHGATTNGLLGYFATTANYTDIVIAIPTTGSWTLSLIGSSKLGNSCQIYIEPTESGGNGTLLGTSTLPATGGGWGTDTTANASAVADPVVATLTAGPHVLRIAPVLGGSHGAGLMSLTATLN